MFQLWLRRATAGCLSIFHYHKVPSDQSLDLSDGVNIETFKSALNRYQRWFKFLPLEEAFDRLSSNSLNEPTAALTFDDGYVDWFDGVVPYLKENRIPATFFITSGQLHEEMPFWHERIARALVLKKKVDLPKGYDWDLVTKSMTIGQKIFYFQEKVKYLSLGEREFIIQSLEDGLPIHSDFRRFTLTDVVKLRDEGFQIGSHSRHHPILACCSYNEAREEIFGCKEDLESILREPINLFAYPNGRPNKDYCVEHVRLVKQAGYRAAVTTAPGVAIPNSDPHQIPRFTPWGSTSWRCALQIIRNRHISPQIVIEQ